MSMIKGMNTKPEIIFQKIFNKNGLRYLLNNRKMPGKSDITFSRYKTVIFINGRLWHGNDDCKYFIAPKTRKEW